MQGQRGESSIRKGVGQGCLLSISLFNLCSEKAVNKIKKEIMNTAVKVKGKTMEMLRFVVIFRYFQILDVREAIS